MDKPQISPEAKAELRKHAVAMTLEESCRPSQVAGMGPLVKLARRKGLDPVKSLASALATFWRGFSSMALAVASADEDQFTPEDHKNAAAMWLGIDAMEESDWTALATTLIAKMGTE